MSGQPAILAVFRALKHFLMDLRDYHVLVRTDNTAVVSYINHQGGLCSNPLYRFAYQILVWFQGKLLSLRAVHIPGHLNMGADILSRQAPRLRERMHQVVKQIWRDFCPGSGEPVAIRDCCDRTVRSGSLWGWMPWFCTCSVPWPRLSLYTFFPDRSAPALRPRVRRDRGRLLLVAPFWPGRLWFSDLITLLDGSPWEFPISRDLLSQAEGMILHPHPELWKMWVWPLRSLRSTHSLHHPRSHHHRKKPSLRLRRLVYFSQLEHDSCANGFLNASHIFLCISYVGISISGIKKIQNT